MIRGIVLVLAVAVVVAALPADAVVGLPLFALACALIVAGRRAR